MGRKRKNGLSEEKRNIIGQLIEIYDIKTAADIQEALKDLLGGTIQSMLETELEEQMEDREEEDPEYHDSRNGYKPKPLKSSMGEIPIQVSMTRRWRFQRSLLCGQCLPLPFFKLFSPPRSGRERIFAVLSQPQLTGKKSCALFHTKAFLPSYSHAMMIA